MDADTLTRAESDATDLVTIPEGKALEFFTAPGRMDPILAMVRKRIDEFKPDLSTETGRKAVASMAYSVSRAKTALEDVGKKLAAEQKEIPKKIDATRKTIRDTLDAWRDEVRAPLDEFEAADEARMDRHRIAIEGIQALAYLNPGLDAANMRARLDTLAAIKIGPECEEYKTAYQNTRDDAVTTLTNALADREQYERDQAELAELRALQKERADREAAEIAAKALAEAEAERDRENAERAEMAAAMARDKAEREAAEAIEAERTASAEREAAAQRQIEDANRRAAETEARVKREAEAEREAEAAETRRREADREHRATINREILAALIEGGIERNAAIDVITLIARKAVPHVAITY